MGYFLYTRLYVDKSEQEAGLTQQSMPFISHSLASVVN